MNQTIRKHEQSWRQFTCLHYHRSSLISVDTPVRLHEIYLLTSEADAWTTEARGCR